jgi:hypothetical protein
MKRKMFKKYKKYIENLFIYIRKDIIIKIEQKKERWKVCRKDGARHLLWF